MPSSIEQQETQAIAKYLKDKNVLIVDPSPVARSSLIRLFIDVGADVKQILFANDIDSAHTIIKSRKPHIIVSEFDVGEHCGLQLVQEQKSELPDSIFIIVTSNTSQAAVARAAEEEVNAYLTKPLTIETVRKHLIRTINSVTTPSEYLLKIEEGKSQLSNKNYDQAYETFKKAIELNSTPSLAYYYLGQIHFLKKELDQAIEEYKKGLLINKIHFKCLLGLYEAFQEQNNIEKAYEVLRKITKYFPSNVKRLSDVFRLAVSNLVYEDIEKYYLLFTKLKYVDDTLIKHTCAALTVCGKHYLNVRAGRIRALQLFEKVAITGPENIGIMKEIAQVLISKKFIKEAKIFLTKFPHDARQSNDYLYLCFLILSQEASDPNIVIQHGRNLINQGINEPNLYHTVISCSYQADQTAYAESLVHEAISKFPEKKEEFEAILASKEKQLKEENQDKSAAS